jgi:hypothetical protein
MLAGGVTAYRCKTQSNTATSSTEAEFVAAVSAFKVTKKYDLRSVMVCQLGFEQKAPTPMFEGNESTIKMVNANCPTKRSCHIDIQYHLAIQDWKKAGHLLLHKIHLLLCKIKGTLSIAAMPMIITICCILTVPISDCHSRIRPSS